MLRAKPTSNGPLAPASNGTYGEVKRYGKLPAKYAHRLSLYGRPPTDEVTTDEFESFGIDRLRILADIETCEARGKSWDEKKVAIEARLKAYLPLHASTAGNVDLAAERRKDLISHFVLRLAVCRTDELRQRFVKAEETLFRVRWDSDDTTEREAFLKSLDFDWQLVSVEEKTRLRSELIASSPGLKDLKERFESETFYKVHWTRVIDLVGHRKVFIHRGYAYVPSREQQSLVFAEFKSRLEKALEVTARALPRLDEDDRLVPVLDHLSQSLLAGIAGEYVARDEADGGEAVTAMMIDGLARQHFPLCMRNMHDTLREKKHLKHSARRQYGLFLKGIGLSLEEALVFWRRGFSSTTDDKFNKEYRYNIRHSYGQEGARKSYQPFSCQQMLTNDLPGPGDAHGCPFRAFSTQQLTATLQQSFPRLTQVEQKEILEQKEKSHYHVACTRLFEASHGLPKGKGIDPNGAPGVADSVTHPCKYVDYSRDWEKVRNGGGEDSMDVDTQS